MTSTMMAMLIYAVSLVEGNPSGGYVDNGHSVGPLCITKACMDDVNRIHKTAFRWPQDARSYEKASQVFILYTQTGGEDLGERVRIWNKGKRGMSKKSAWRYQRKVMNYLH